MARWNYDIILPTQSEPFRCACGTHVWPAEIVAFEKRGDGPGAFVCCLGCAEKAGAEPPAIALVVQAQRLTRERFAEAVCQIVGAGAAPARPSPPPAPPVRTVDPGQRHEVP